MSEKDDCSCGGYYPDNDCPECGWKESSISPACSIAIEPTRIQRKKLQHLLEKEGKCTAATLHVGMPDGSLASIDPYGRVSWTRN
ncbi:MAG: hypothetical protein GY941_26415 [Planctomycetes bacterium]|nr:hypothetical protein [Planctomycetota bacterium]